MHTIDVDSQRLRQQQEFLVSDVGIPVESALIWKDRSFGRWVGRSSSVVYIKIKNKKQKYVTIYLPSIRWDGRIIYSLLAYLK